MTDTDKANLLKEAKDVLAFYGSLLGAVATILALSETITMELTTKKVAKW